MLVNKLAKFVSICSFLLLFAWFPVYHTLLAKGLMSPIFGGLFSPISAVTLLVFCIILPLQVKSIMRYGGYFFIFCTFFFIYIFIWTCLHYFISDSKYVEIAAQQSLLALLQYLAIFYIAIFLPVSNAKLQKLLWITLVVYFIYLLIFVISTGELMFYARMQHESNGLSDSVASYQGFSRSVLVLLLVILATLQKHKWQFLLVGVGLFILFVLGSRSELYAFVFAIGVFFSFWSFKSKKVFLLFLLLLSCVLIYVLNNIETLISSRQLQILDLENASSWIARNQMLAAAIDQICSSPILGSFGAHISDAESVGNYAHNALSAWINYGLLGFVLLLGLTVYALVQSWVLYKSNAYSKSYWCFSFLCNLTNLLLMLISKPVFWPMAALGWGAYIGARIQLKRQNLLEVNESAQRCTFN